GCKFGSGHRAYIGPNLTFPSALETSTEEGYSGAGVGGMQGECHGQAGMHADSRQGDLIAKCRLPTKPHAPFPPRRPLRSSRRFPTATLPPWEHQVGIML